MVWFLVGCATQPHPPAVRLEMVPQPQEQEEDPFRIFPDTFRARAVAQEKKGELRQALFSWKIVRSFKPEDPESLENIEYLGKLIRTEADRHLQNGLDYLNSGSLQAARKEFLLVLAYDPEHQAALDYLRTKTSERDYTAYEIREGDTLESIVKRMYGDPKKDFLVTYFSGLGSNGELKPGTVLRLPIVEAEPKREIRAEAKAETKHRIVSPPKVLDKARAEDHYRKGVNYFLAEDLQRAIKEWGETLRLDPTHPNAKGDIEKARSLLVNIGLK
jgi:tetratricopeptide (TPR) repeat protein